MFDVENDGKEERKSKEAIRTASSNLIDFDWANKENDKTVKEQSRVYFQRTSVPVTCTLFYP